MKKIRLPNLLRKQRKATPQNKGAGLPRLVFSPGLAIIFLFFFGVWIKALSAPSDPPSVSPSPESTAGYGRTVELVTLRNAPPAQIEQALRAISRKWGLFPSLDYLTFQFSTDRGNLLLLRGEEEEAARAARVATALDGFFPSPKPASALFRISLSHLSAPAMRDKLLELSRLEEQSWTDDQFLIFPPGPGGSLFFKGTAAEAQTVRELRDELDQPRYETFADMVFGFWRTFRADLSSHFLIVSTYAASALILLLLHFILVHIPFLGKYYERAFTLIWTKIFDNVKGRGFILDVIRKSAVTAVESVEQSVSQKGPAQPRQASAVPPEDKKRRAMAVASGILKFRGINPADPRIRSLVSEEIEAEVYRLEGKKEKEVA